MNLIVAVDNGWGIGIDNQLLYSLKGDMSYFRSKTIDKVVVMGDKTLESLPGGQPLKRRINICISANKDYSKQDVIVVHSIDELIYEASKYNSDDVFVIGGAYVYKQMLPYCSYAYITKIKDTRPADKFFENLDNIPAWELIEESPDQQENGITYNFCIYKNNQVLK